MPTQKKTNLEELLAQLNAVAPQLPDSALRLYEPQPEHAQFFDDLTRAYLAADDEERQAIRQAASEKPGLLNHLTGYVYKSAHQLHPPADRAWLQSGLAAASIENCSVDFRDSLLALAELFLAAEAAGLDPRPDFETVAKLSSNAAPRGGTMPVAQMLRDFHKSVLLDSERKRRRKTDNDNY